MTKRIETTTYPPQRRQPTESERRLGVVTFDDCDGARPVKGVTASHATAAPLAASRSK